LVNSRRNAADVVRTRRGRLGLIWQSAAAGTCSGRATTQGERQMIKSGIDQDAMIKMFAEASVKQGEVLRKAVSDATLKALQGRELTLQNIRGVLGTMTKAASAGSAQNPAALPDVEAMLGKAFAGMDAALLQAVEANRKALQQFVDQGVDLREKHIRGALANLEKMEDTFFATVGKAAQAAGGPLQAPWQNVLETMKLKGTATGSQATATVEQMMAQAQTALREGRSASLRTAQAMLDSYSALVSGVLIGMSEGLQQAKAPAAGAGRARKA
jgi:primosomal protein N''